MSWDDRMEIYYDELTQAGHNVRALSCDTVAHLLVARYGMGYERADELAPAVLEHADEQAKQRRRAASFWSGR